MHEANRAIVATSLQSLTKNDSFDPEDEGKYDVHRVKEAVAEGAVGLTRLQMPLSVEVVQTSPAKLVFASAALHEFAAGFANDTDVALGAELAVEHLVEVDK